MSFQVTTAFVQQYRANVDLLSQQKGSKLRSAVRQESVVGKNAFFDQIGSAAAVKRQTRHGDTPMVNTPHSRRRLTLVDYDWADLIDNLDKVKMLNDPTSDYAMTAAFAMGRAIDDEIIASALATAYTGEDGSTGVTFPTGTNQIAHGGVGLTVGKLANAKQILDTADVDPEEPRFFVLGAQQLRNLLDNASDSAKFVSADYNTIKALVRGEIDTFMGFKFIMSNRLAKASTTRSCLCWAQGGMLLGVGAEPRGAIDTRPDKNYATQVYYGMSIGATRMEEAKVVEVQCTEA
jgi:hypothetical protein